MACVLVGCGGDAFSAAATDAGGHPSDTGTADTGMPSDTGSPPMEAGASWCAGQTVMFCEDFDEYANFNAVTNSTTWPVYNKNKCMFSFDTTTPKSPPNSLQANGDDGADLLIVHTFAKPVAPKTLRLEFDLRIDSAGTVGPLSAAGFAAIAFGTNIDSGFAAIAIGAGPVISAAWVMGTVTMPGSDAGSFMAANAPASDFPSLGQWSARYALEVQYGATSGTSGACVQVYQGATPLLTPCLPLPAELLKPGPVSIAIGDEASGFRSTGQVDIEFDNVTFDVTH